MMVLTVDLASKFSAAMVQELGYGVLCEFDSAGMTAFAFAAKIARVADEYGVDLVLVEDVPYGISSQAMTKPVLRLQGVVITMNNKNLDRLLFVNPQSWQKYYPGVASVPKEIGKGMTKAQKDEYRIEAARVAAADLGYTAPNLIQAYIDSLPDGAKVLKKHTNPLAKSMTDYVDAFLMGQWALGQDNIHTVSGVQPPNI